MHGTHNTQSTHSAPTDGRAFVCELCDERGNGRTEGRKEGRTGEREGVWLWRVRDMAGWSPSRAQHTRTLLTPMRHLSHPRTKPCFLSSTFAFSPPVKKTNTHTGLMGGDRCGHYA